MSLHKDFEGAFPTSERSRDKMGSIPEDASGSQWLQASRTITTKSVSPPEGSSPAVDKKWSGSSPSGGKAGSSSTAGSVLKSIGIDAELEKKLAEKANKEKAASAELEKGGKSEKSVSSSASAPPPSSKALPIDTKDTTKEDKKMPSSASLPATSPMAQPPPQSPTPKVRWSITAENNTAGKASPKRTVPPSPPSPWRIQSPALANSEIMSPAIATTLSEEEAADQIVLLGRYLPSRDPIRCSDTEIILPALDLVVAENASSSPVILQFLTDPTRVAAELNSRSGLDPSYVLVVKAAFADETAKSVAGIDDNASVPVRPRRGLAEEVALLDLGCHGHSYLLVLEDHGPTLQDRIMHFPKKNLDFARDVVADIVVAFIVLHTEGRVHRDLKLRNIVSTKLSGNSVRWKLKGFGSCTSSGETGDATASHWGYWPPEIASLYQEGVAVTTTEKDAALLHCQADPTWDLWSLGCILYRLVFGSNLWNESATEQIDAQSIQDLAAWSALEVTSRAEKEFPIQSRTDQEKAAIDLVSRLLAPTPTERKQNFEMGIISVHQHEFLEGKPLDPHNLQVFEERQNLLTSSRFEQERFVALTGGLSLEEKWELNRARDVLLMGALEPAHVHVPTNYVILKKPLPDELAEESTEDAQARLFEGMRWVDKMNDIGPLVIGALDGDVSSVGRFWSKISGMFEGSYVYLYFVDDLTGEPVRGDPAGTFAGNGPYPIPIMTWSDSLPKLLPLMHLTMRSMALYHGAAGIARMFGSNIPILPEKMRSTVQAKIDELKHESTGSPFGQFGEDIELARVHRERFLQSDKARCKCLREYIRFLERKGFLPGEDFVGLRRLSDERGRAIWTMLNTADTVKEAIAKRADERLKEEMKLWGDRQEYRIVDLREKIKEQEAALSKAKANTEKAKEAAREATESRTKVTHDETERISELKAALAQARTELQKSCERVKVLEAENARQYSATPSPAPSPSAAPSINPPPPSHIHTVTSNPISPPKTATQYVASSSSAAAATRGPVSASTPSNASVSSNSTTDHEDELPRHSTNLLKDEHHKKKKKWTSVTGRKK